MSNAPDESAAPDESVGQRAEPVSTPAPEAPNEPAAERTAEPTVRASRDDVRVRRAPKYPVFIFGGIILGVVVTFIAVLVAPGDPSESFIAVFGYFLLYGIAFGALLGSIVAVIFDAVANRRAKQIELERTVVEPPVRDEVVEGELEDD